jgi:hypothetical protein
MRSLIAVVLLLFANQAYANKWPIWPQIQSVNSRLGWQIDKIQVIGHNSRVPLYGGQDPFPFCASVAASILHDQHECMNKNQDCSVYPRTSALSLVSSSQGTPNRINWDNGGVTILALKQVLKNGGAASHLSCNYDTIVEPRKNKGVDFVRIYGNYANHKQFRKWGGYLQRYYRDEFIWEVTQLGLYRKNLDAVLSKDFNSPHDLFNSIIVTEECGNIEITSSKQYTLKIIDNPDQDIKLSYEKIQYLLKNNTPVGINLCLNIDVGLKTCSKHSLVIFAEGLAKNTITGDIRRVYHLANTWSEHWHKDHNDGWVFADQLLLGVYSMFWLE